jgi:hypothetical protein
MDFEFIDENEIEGVKRGRKTTVPTELVDLFKTMPKGKAVRLPSYKGDVSDPVEYKAYKGAISGTIRKAGELAGVKVSITWSLDGIPQVKVRTPKVSKSSK